MCDDAPPPDPQIGQAARENAQIAREALQYYRERDKEGKPRQEKMDAIAVKLADQQIATSEFNTAQAKKVWDRYEKSGIPAEDRMYKDAAEYDSKGKVAEAVGAAATDVDVAMNSANEARRRTMMRAGVNPADGRAKSMEQEGATAGALGKAAAMNAARTRVKDMGIMLRKDSANFAKGMPGTAGATYGVAGAAGQGATGALSAAGAMSAQSAATMGQGFNIGIQGNQSSAGILNGLHSAAVGAAGQEGANNASIAGTVATIGIAI